MALTSTAAVAASSSLSASPSQLKVLTVGPPCGRIRELVTKVSAINAKYGPFDALLCLGDVFRPHKEGAELSVEETELIEGSLKLPIPLFFALPPSPLHPRIRALITQRQATQTSFSDDPTADSDPMQVAPGLFFLGKAGVCKLPARSGANALRVAVAGGAWDAQLWRESVGREEGVLEGLVNPTMTAASIDRLLAHPAFQEPAETKTVSAAPDDETPSSLAAARAQLAKKSSALQEQADRAAKPPVDVLLTTAWPAGITMFSNAEKLPHATSRVWGAPVIAKLVRNSNPRYHFALAPGSLGDPDDDEASFGVVGLDGTPEGAELRRTGSFWEREPFRAEAPTHPLCTVTRFVSLARFANEKKARWFMALNMAPASAVAPAQAVKTAPKPPTNATPSPFAGGGGYGGGGSGSSNAANAGVAKRKDIEDDMTSGANFRWAERTRKQPRNKANGLGTGDGPSGLPNKPDVPMPERPIRRVLPVGPEDCWFCLSNPQCAKHLIVAIGSECYIAMPKGQLPPTSDPLSPVPGGGHVLIVPIEHFPSLLGHPDAKLVVPIAAEMAAWREALSKTYASFNAVPVSWEICRTTGTRAGHMQKQVVPVPQHLAGGLADCFRAAAAKYAYKMIEDRAEVARFLQLPAAEESSESRVQARGDYFRLDIGNDTTWLLPLPRGTRFYLQFPRETLSAYLGVPDRADWKRCARSEAIETAEAKAFKSAFDGFAEGIGG